MRFTLVSSFEAPIPAPLPDQVLNHPVAEDEGAGGSEKKDPPEDCFGHSFTSSKMATRIRTGAPTETTVSVLR